MPGSAAGTRLNVVSDATRRKQRQRERDAALGITVAQVPLSIFQRQQLLESCITRGGIRGPYDVTEYITTLIRRDAEKLQRDMSQLGKCGHCDRILPEGCGGKKRQEEACWHHASKSQLLL